MAGGGTVTDELVEAWTWREFCLEMRRAGWSRNLTAGFFQHKVTQRQFTPFNFDATRPKAEQTQWKRWANMRQTPPPF